MHGFCTGKGKRRYGDLSKGQRYHFRAGGYCRICLNNTFYTREGFTEDAAVKRHIYEHICDLGLTGLSRHVDQLFQALRLEAYVERLPVYTDRIPVLNGSLCLNGTFTDEKEICLNRLQVYYNPDAPLPLTWLRFLDDLLDYDDQITLQEYMGYCLIPSTKAQQMLFLIGSGGEGKSRIGLVLKKMFGVSCNMSSLHKIELNQFARADLENKLLMVDDDLRMSALPSTNYIKTIVTAEEATDIERKGQQSVQRLLYSRLLCLGNGSPSALYDKSKGFYRRQIILTTKDKPEDRADDPYLIEKLTAELDGIFLWCFSGLQQLVQNRFRFTISDRARENLREAEAILHEQLENHRYLEELPAEVSVLVSPDIRICEYMDYWLSRKKRDVKQTTFESYEIYVAHIKSFFKQSNPRIVDITPKMIDNYFRFELEYGKTNQKTKEREPLAVRSVRSHKGILNAVFNQASIDGLIRMNPVHGVVVHGKQNRMYSEEMLFLTEEEVSEMLHFLAVKYPRLLGISAGQ